MIPLKALLMIVIGLIGAMMLISTIKFVIEKYQRIPVGQLYTTEIEGDADYISERIAKGIYQCWWQTECGRHKQPLMCKRYQVKVREERALDEADITKTLRELDLCGLCNHEDVHMGIGQWALPGLTYYWGCFVSKNGEEYCNQIPNCRFENGDGETCPIECYGYENLNNRIIWKGDKIYAEKDVKIRYDFHKDWRMKGWGRIIIEVA